ncbi:MAG: NADH-quinone oxidoreductase subunit C [Deltaproteobacteria bacterium]|nr:NADH-quinone oxidoreductase subunit C [Deltaproteobacteria bacterium]
MVEEAHGDSHQKGLSAAVAGRVSFVNGRDLVARLHRAEDLLSAVVELTGPRAMSLATIVGTDELTGPDHDLKLFYVFEPASSTGARVPLPRRGSSIGLDENAESERPEASEGLPLEDRFVTIVISLDPNRPEVPSITPNVPAATWHEREAQDMFGIIALGHPDPRPLVLHDGWPRGLYPLRKSFDARLRPPVEAAPEFPHLVVEGEGVFEIPVGPIHAGIIEPGHFRFSSVGETVLHLEARLFYTHRGLEKRVEGLSAIDAFYVAERLCGVCSVSHGLAFAEAVEQIAQIEVPLRGRVLRSVALELERLYNHVGDIGNICAGASYHYGTSAGLRLKEKLQAQNEWIAGNRFLRGLVVPGGVGRDLSATRARSLDAILTETAEELADLILKIDSNPSVVDRLDETGILTRRTALDLGVTGIAARASGIDRDARRDHPHAAFATHRPRVRTRSEGDVEARLELRADEAHESIRLLRSIIKDLPDGPLAVRVPDSLPPGRVGLVSVESPRGAVIHWLRSDATGRIDRLHVRSASYANWPAVPHAAMTAIVPDFPLVNKSFELCYSCTDR